MDTPQRWFLRDDNAEWDLPGVLSHAEALAAAEESLRSGDWGEGSNKTLFLHARLFSHDSDESERIRVVLRPEEPPCSEDEHDWRSPYQILGGLKANPGVRGNGGGVIIEQVCLHCGCSKIENTWAHDPTTGEQGLTSIEYQVDKYAEEVAASNHDD